MEAERISQSPAKMPPKLKKGETTRQVNTVMPESLFARLEEWRSSQRPIPGRGEAIRSLMEIALDAIAKKGGKGK